MALKGRCLRRSIAIVDTSRTPVRIPVNSVGSAAIVITKADATIVVNGYTGIYDGAAHGATGAATGVLSEALAGLDLGASFSNGWHSRSITKLASRLIAMTFRHPSRLVSPIAQAFGKMPALSTRTSSPPKVRTAVSSASEVTGMTL